MQREDAIVAERAHAKVNLTLGVKGRRADGYHELESLVVFADLSDELRFDPHGEPGLVLAGPFADAVEGGNLVDKAADAVRAWFGLPLTGRFTLTKNIPVAAGLGGGSSDAAAAIRAVARAYGLALDDIADLPAQAARIGADVPVCLAQGPAWMLGLGERVEPLRYMPALPAVLVNPRIPLATREVFQRLDAPALGDLQDGEMRPLSFDRPKNVIAFLRERTNDLEPPATALAPAVAQVLAALRDDGGCLLARLSGSGPTCFGLFASAFEAEAAARRLAGAQPGWWVQPVRLC